MALVEREELSKPILSNILQKQAMVRYPNRVEFDYSVTNVAKAVDVTLKIVDALLTYPDGPNIAIAAEIIVKIAEVEAEVRYPNRIEYDFSTANLDAAVKAAILAADTLLAVVPGGGDPGPGPVDPPIDIPDKITLITITGLTAPSTIIDLTANGATWTKMGPSASIGSTSGVFNSNPRYSVYRCGQNLVKDQEVIYQTSSSIAIPEELDIGEQLVIVS